MPEIVLVDGVQEGGENVHLVCCFYFYFFVIAGEAMMSGHVPRVSVTGK